MSDKIVTMNDVKKHKEPNNAWIIIHNDVYNITRFIREHPGGEQALLDYAGKDGTQAFEDVGHSDDARALLANMKVGSLSQQERKIHTKNWRYSQPCEKSNKWKYILLALALAAGAAFAYKKYKG